MKLGRNFPQASVYPYSVFKLGWCYYKKADYQGALKQFIRLIKTQRALTKTHHLVLKRVAQYDLLKAYVNITEATAIAGLKLIKQYAPKRFKELGRILADLYKESGDIAKYHIVTRRIDKEP